MITVIVIIITVIFLLFWPPLCYVTVLAKVIAVIRKQGSIATVKPDRAETQAAQALRRKDQLLTRQQFSQIIYHLIWS